MGVGEGGWLNITQRNQNDVGQLGEGEFDGTPGKWIGGIVVINKYTEYRRPRQKHTAANRDDKSTTEKYDDGRKS